MHCVSKFTTFLPQPEGAFPCRYPGCPCRYFQKAGGANKHMVSKHGITPPNSYLYLPAAKMPKQKRAKRSTEEGAAGMISMPMDDSCAYHLASMAIYATSNPNKVDVDLWPSDADGARDRVIDKYLGMREKVQKYVDELPLGYGSDQLAHWENMMNEYGSAEDFVDAAADKTKWGGSVELAIAMDDTTTCITIVHADNISAKATDVAVEGAVQPAMLRNLTEGARKTHNVFAILRKGHYYLGYVRTGGVNRGLFEVGDESDSAKELLIKFLKSSNSAAIQRKRKRERGKPKQASCLSEDEELMEEASADESRGIGGARKRPKRRNGQTKQVSCVSGDGEPRKNASAQSGDSFSAEYDENEMVIYTSDDDPSVLLVGAVIEVVG